MNHTNKPNNIIKYHNITISTLLPQKQLFEVPLVRGEKIKDIHFILLIYPTKSVDNKNLDIGGFGSLRGINLSTDLSEFRLTPQTSCMMIRHPGWFESA